MEGNDSRRSRRATCLLLGPLGLVLGCGLLLAQPRPAHAAGDVGLSPSVLRFGSQEEGTTSSTKEVRVTNNDVVPLLFNGIFISNGDNADFVIRKDGCGQQLAPGDNCGIDVAFRPASGTFGPRSSTLEIHDNSASGDVQAITLVGQVASPDVDVEPSDISFGPQPSGTVSAPRSVTLTNHGDGELNVTDLKLDPTDDFDVVSGDCFRSIEPGAGCSIDVRFSPKTASGDVKAIRTTILTITDNDPSTPNQLVSIDGSVPTPVAELSTSSLDFGSQAAGTTSAAQSVTVRNTGTGPLTLGAIQVAGLDPNDFAVSHDACPGTLNPGQSCQIAMVFAPEKADGHLSALLTLTDDSPNVTQTVALHGLATAAPGSATPPAPRPAASEPAAGPAAVVATPDATASPTPDPTAAATPDAVSSDGVDPASVVERPAVTGGAARHPAARQDGHGLLAGALLSAVANDGAVLHAILTAALMALPLAVLAGLVRLGWMLRRRRRAA